MLCAFAKLRAEPLSIELVSEVTSIQPGTPFYVGLHLKHQEHYHTYWKFPGIVGVPTSMAWKLPPGWTAGPIEWPAPERVMMFQIKAQGYHGEVLLPMKITPPANLEPGTKITLQGKATWMCCGLDCNPGFADLSVSLPVDNLPAPTDKRCEGLFAKARADMARPLEGYDVKATRDKDRVTLTLVPQPDRESVPAPARARPPGIVNTGRGDVNLPHDKRFDTVPGVAPPLAEPSPEMIQQMQKRIEALLIQERQVLIEAMKHPAIFFTEDGYINPNEEQSFRKERSGFTMNLYISTYFTDPPPDELRGVLWMRDGSLGSGVIIHVPFTEKGADPFTEKEAGKPPPPRKLPPEELLR